MLREEDEAGEKRVGIALRVRGQVAGELGGEAG